MAQVFFAPRTAHLLRRLGLIKPAESCTAAAHRVRTREFHNGDRREWNLHDVLICESAGVYSKLTRQDREFEFHS